MVIVKELNSASNRQQTAEQRSRRRLTQPQSETSVAATRVRRATGRSTGCTPASRRLPPEQGASAAEATAAAGRQQAAGSSAPARRHNSFALTRARRAASFSAAEGRCTAAAGSTPTPQGHSMPIAPTSRARTRARSAANRTAAGEALPVGGRPGRGGGAAACRRLSSGMPETGWKPERSAKRRRAAPRTVRLQRVLAEQPVACAPRERKMRTARGRGAAG